MDDHIGLSSEPRGVCRQPRLSLKSKRHVIGQEEISGVSNVVDNSFVSYTTYVTMYVVSLSLFNAGPQLTTT